MAGISNHVDPFTPKYCTREDCFVCRTAGRPTNGICWKLGAVYRIDCIRCKLSNLQAVYIGESGFSGYFRGKSHLEALRTGAADSVLHGHNLTFHPEGSMSMRDFQMSIISNHHRPIMRQCQEGLEIAHIMRESEARGRRIILMNSKSQFYQPGVVRARYGPLQG